MKRLIGIALVLSLMAPLGMAQENDVSPTYGLTATLSNGIQTNGLGDFLWSLDVETPTGDIRCLGVEYDGTNYWVTGAFDFTIAYLYEIKSDGTVVNTFPQPTANWGGWGWRDLAYDGMYLYAGNPNNGYIQQIDMTTGVPTGVQYGPFPVTPCRALAYDSNMDCFWTASFSSSIYQCFKDGTYNTFTNPGLSLYGAAMQDSDPANPLLWWWSQDGSFGCLASEMDPNTGIPTGRTFEGDATVGGIAGGACAYDAGGGMYEFVGLHQASPDSIAAYDLNTVKLPLMADKDKIEAWTGGTVNFKMDAGNANAGRYYVTFMGVSGQTPGFFLPSGKNVPVNWDSYTNAWLNAMLPGFYGTLDGSGTSSASLTIPRLDITSDITMTFAYALDGPAWDFVSNPVDILLKAWMPNYIYDDGSCENILGWTSGGEICFMHPYDSGPGDIIDGASNTYGSTTYPGYGPGNGTSTTVFIWDDPTNDMNPSDCMAPLDMVGSTIQNEDLDIFVDTKFNSAQSVSGIFFLGVNIPHSAGMYVCPIDMDTAPPAGTTWYAGVPGGVFDYKNVGNNTLGQYTSGPWLLRALPQ